MKENDEVVVRAKRTGPTLTITQLATQTRLSPGGPGGPPGSGTRN
ncbi:hypothetical protein N4S67_00390 [Mycobacterium sp. CPCC 205710]|uniref:Uncharacterized protein n=1 Tax=Mycobacterium deserti TaxID=2978347 RepID=A0ABT2M3N0_9MYCO|nr:hypothetical protein [Mycobacterium deserti]